tara:strand:- start:394 stop:609 length:216 start_codon:yes stop_codon:yes gene_type:complete
MKKSINKVIELAVKLVLSRSGDVTTEDGNFATVDDNIIIELDCAIAEAFDLNSDDVNESDLPDIIDKLSKL